MTLVRVHNGHRNGFLKENRMPEGSMIRSFLNDANGENEYDFIPEANIAEKEKSYLIQLALPGFAKEDISIQVDNGLLTISNINSNDQPDGLKFIRKEITSGTFRRIFRLSKIVNQEKVEASMVNGILNIEVAKKEEAVKKPKREITIS